MRQANDRRNGVVGGIAIPFICKPASRIEANLVLLH